MKDLSELDLENQADEGDPLVWLRKYRDEVARKFPSLEELDAYLRSTPPLSEIIREVDRKIAEKHRLGYKSTDYYSGEEGVEQSAKSKVQSAE